MLVKYGVALEFSCPKRDYVWTTLYQVGLMCSGHYGKLGFLHAMMSSDDWDKMSGRAYGPRISGDKARDITRAKILAWAAFTYNVAAGRQSLDDRVCDAVAAKYRPLADAFRDNLDDWRECTGGAASWKVRDFFTFLCPNPAIPDPAKPELETKPCGRLGDANADDAARLNAEGALLHMIQDSYSQSHVRRLRDGQPDGLPPRAAIVCTPPLLYYYYDPTNRSYHSSYDKEPWIDALSCRNGAVDDPVSAGATLIAMLADKQRPTSDFIDYLSARVFPLP